MQTTGGWTTASTKQVPGSKMKSDRSRQRSAKEYTETGLWPYSGMLEMQTDQSNAQCLGAEWLSDQTNFGFYEKTFGNPQSVNK